MTNTSGISPQPATNKMQEDRKTIRSLQSLSSIITLGAWLSILTGIVLIWMMVASNLGFFVLVGVILAFVSGAGLFWCDRLLQQKSQRAITVYAAILIGGWVVILMMRLVNSWSLLGFRDLFGLLLPGAILFEMYKLKKKGVLV